MGIGSSPHSLFFPPVRRLNRSQDRAEVAFLLFERPHGDNDLGAGVIEGHEQAPVPAQDSRRRVAQLVIMVLDQFQSVERDRAERGDDRRIDQFDLAAQEIGAVANLRTGGFVVRAGRFARAAKDGVGDEDLIPRQFDRAQKRFEVPARRVAGWRAPWSRLNTALRSRIRSQTAQAAASLANWSKS
jgi:hypothetical protein